MNFRSPTFEELERLPLRAIVAYAARAARRISSELRGIVADQLIDDLLRLVETALDAESMAGGDKALTVVAAERIIAAYIEAPADAQSREKYLVVTFLVQAGLAAMYAVLAVENSSNARHHIRCAAQCAQHVVNPIRSLGGKMADSVTQAARRDYDILLREYGEHKEVVIGGPVTCFDAE